MAREHIFNLPSVKILVDLFLSLEKKEKAPGKTQLDPCGKATDFWESFPTRFYDDLSALSLDTVNGNGEMLPVLVRTLIHGEGCNNRAEAHAAGAQAVVCREVPRPTAGARGGSQDQGTAEERPVRAVQGG